jgi:hypothetical protein
MTHSTDGRAIHQRDTLPPSQCAVRHSGPMRVSPGAGTQRQIEHLPGT